MITPATFEYVCNVAFIIILAASLPKKMLIPATAAFSIFLAFYWLISQAVRAHYNNLSAATCTQMKRDQFLLIVMSIGVVLIASLTRAVNLALKMQINVAVAEAERVPAAVALSHLIFETFRWTMACGVDWTMLGLTGVPALLSMVTIMARDRLQRADALLNETST